jgi:hypothetical protein
MGIIYESCQEVIIWLSDTKEDKQIIKDGASVVTDYLAA